MDSGLVGLQKKGMLLGESFAASKEQLVLGGVVSVQSVRLQMEGHPEYKEMDFPGGPEVKSPPANAGVQSLVWKLRPPQALEQQSLCATTTELVGLEPVLCNKRSHYSEKPVHFNEE